jgi:hypothetical protein
MAPDLPTHNARKTWTLAIWLLQTQRLPLSITAPANDRILASLWRGISSKLGRGGKPGTMSNGFRTSATIAALLRHIAISLDYYGKEEDMELPTQMLLTVNTTLAGLYPSQPTAALVFFPALLDSVNNCPQNLLVSLLVTLRKGLCAWFEDSREALGDETYTGVVCFFFSLFTLWPLSSIIWVGCSTVRGNPRSHVVDTSHTKQFSQHGPFDCCTVPSCPAPCHCWPLIRNILAGNVSQITLDAGQVSRGDQNVPENI